MHNNIVLFKTHQPIKNHQIQQASGQIAATAIGTIKLSWQKPDSITHIITMKNVLYVPDLFMSLLSVMKLRSREVKFNSEDGILYHIPSRQVVGSSDQRYRHWLLRLTMVEGMF